MVNIKQNSFSPNERDMSPVENKNLNVMSVTDVS